MITDTAVEAAAAVLEERGWERDEEMVEDVRAALEAAQGELVAAALAEEKRRLARERARRQAESKRQARWRHVPRPRPAPADMRGPAGPREDDEAAVRRRYCQSQSRQHESSPAISSPPWSREASTTPDP